MAAAENGSGLAAATVRFMGESFTLLDCPGAVDFRGEARAALPSSDAAIVELRSASQGVASFETAPSHLAELSGRLADQVLAARKSRAA